MQFKKLKIWVLCLAKGNKLIVYTDYSVQNYLGARCLDVKTLSYQHRDSHYKDKKVSWPSYLHNGNPHTFFRLRGVPDLPVPMHWKYSYFPINMYTVHGVVFCCGLVKGLIMDSCVLLTLTPECVVSPRRVIMRAQPEAESANFPVINKVLINSWFFCSILF